MIVQCFLAHTCYKLFGTVPQSHWFLLRWPSLPQNDVSFKWALYVHTCNWTQGRVENIQIYIVHWTRHEIITESSSKVSSDPQGFYCIYLRRPQDPGKTAEFCDAARIHWHWDTRDIHWSSQGKYRTSSTYMGHICFQLWVGIKKKKSQFLLHRSFGIGIRWILIGINEVPGGKSICNIHYFSLNIQGSEEKCCVIWNVLWRKEVIDGESYHMWDLKVNVGLMHICQLSFLVFFPFQNNVIFFTLSWVFSIFSNDFQLAGALSRKQNCPSSGEIKVFPFPGTQEFQTQRESSEGLHPFVMAEWRVQQESRLCPCRRK